MADLLGEWVIQFSASGQEALAAALQQTQAKVGGLEVSGKAVHAALGLAEKNTRQFENLKGTLNKVRKAFDEGKVSGLGALQAIANAEQKAERDFEARNRQLAEAEAQREARRLALIDRRRRSLEAAARAEQSGLAALTSAYATLTGTVMSFVRAGLQGTGQGEMIGLQFQMISREVANLFVPVINRVVTLLTQTTMWFRSLSAEQQQNYARWLLTGAGILAVVAYLPRLALGFQAVGSAAQLAFAHPILLAVAAVALLLTRTEAGRRAMADIGERLSPLFDRLVESAEKLGPAFDAAAEGVGRIAAGLERALQFADKIGSALGFKDKGKDSLTDKALGAAWQATFATMPGVSQLMAIGEASRLFGGGTPNVRVGGASARDQLAPRAGGAEDVRALFQRLQTAASKTDIPQRQLTVLEEIRDELRGRDAPRQVPTRGGYALAAIGP